MRSLFSRCPCCHGGHFGGWPVRPAVRDDEQGVVLRQRSVQHGKRPHRDPRWIGAGPRRGDGGIGLHGPREQSPRLSRASDAEQRPRRRSATAATTAARSSTKVSRRAVTAGGSLASAGDDRKTTSTLSWQSAGLINRESRVRVPPGRDANSSRPTRSSGRIPFEGDAGSSPAWRPR